jgi:hypothetical protein
MSNIEKVMKTIQAAMRTGRVSGANLDARGVLAA